MFIPRTLRWALLPALCLLIASCDSLDEAPPAPGTSLLRVERGGEVSAKVGLYATSVVSATQGEAVPGGAIDPARSNPANALNAPDAAFFSLGFDRPATATTEGELVLGFGTGQLLKGLTLTVFEETYGGAGALLESADVYVSANATGPWQLVGTARNDGSVGNTRPSSSSIAGTCVRFVRLVDRTNRAAFTDPSKPGDGFDVNAVEIESDGPCATSHTILGNVFSDENGDTAQDATESGIQDVQVMLTDGATTVYATTTAGGQFSFSVAPGTYQVSVPNNAPGHFNALLYDTHDYTGTGAAERTVTVGPDAAGVDFGFLLDVTGVEEDLRSGRIGTESEAAKFWTREIRHACLGSHARVAVTANQFTMYLDDIEGLLLTVPFQFGAGNKYCAALAILAPQAKGAFADFWRELLTAEFNFVSGNGTSTPAFDLALLGFAEAVGADLLNPSSSKSSGIEADLREVTDMLSAYNSSGGGGGVGGPK